MVSDEEIYSACLSMGPFKAPSTDDLHAVFFKSQWDIVGKLVCDVVKDAFSNLSSIEDINETLLVFIPKVDCPKTLKDIRPISLCNVIYKIIIPSRLTNYLEVLILPNHFNFVLGRHNSDNIIKAQEVIHSMRRMKGVKGFMAIKLA